MKAMKKSAMKTMKAMKAMKKHVKPMKTMKAMKKSATATGHAKLMQAKAAMNSKAVPQSLQLMAAMKSKAVTYQSTMFTEIVMHTEIIEISYETDWGNMWWSLPAGESADLMRKFRAIESGPKVVRFDSECATRLHRWSLHLHELGPDGEPTANTSYKWDFDNLKQRNMTTHLERNFRIIRLNAMMFA